MNTAKGFPIAIGTNSYTLQIMIKNYFKIAWRNLLKNKMYSFVNIFGLAVGMAVTIMIGLWMNDELSRDDYFTDKAKIAQVWQSQTFNGNTGTGPAIPLPLEPTLRNGYGNNFEHLTMSSWTQDRYLKYGDISLSKTGNYMQAPAVDLFELRILKGSKSGLEEMNSIMLAASTAEAIFGSEEAIGKVIKINSENDVKVTAVYEDFPLNSSFSDTKFIAPWDLYAKQNWIKNSLDSWGNNSFQMFVRIADNTTMDKVSTTIKDVKKNADEDIVQYNPQLFLLPMEDWYLRSNFEDGVRAGGRIENVWLFGIIGTFVLLLACINFMNLSTARSEKRAKEVGIRKSIGSVRSQLISQFLSESLLVVSLAFVLALILVLASLSGFNELASKEMEFPWASGTFWLVSLSFVLLTALLSGSYPALYLSSFQPIKVLKGTFKAGRFASLPRKVLVVVQFTVSVALIIGTMVVYQQIQHSKNRPIGYDKEGLVQLPILGSDFEGKYDFMRNEFISSGAVIEISSSSSPTTQVWSNRSGWTWEGKLEGFQEDLAYTEVSYEYAKSLNLTIIAGRDFDRKLASDSNAVLINETAVKYLGIAEPVGKFLRDDSDEDPGPSLQIIGVIEDVLVQSPYEPVKQALYRFDRYGNQSYYNLRLNPDKSASANVKTIEKVFKKNFPNLPFLYEFVDEQFAKKFASEERIGNLSGIFTGLAILISCLGLFGLASFVAEQRTKEIGVRKVLGASVQNLWAMLSKDFIWLVFISLFIASPIAWYFMSGWLDKFEYRTDLSWSVFAIAGIGALTITLLTVSFQAIKAALMDPVKSLRSE
ncbi:MAG: ABC-type antimicrobial peptide transport system permease subunit [Spirosomataceae bacterium]|jgi:ABC-type antimicrobial peptide transport system permease subunit